MAEQFVSREDALALIQRLRENPNEKAKSSELFFRGVSLRGVDLSGLHLAGAVFTSADLSGANLTKANLFKANFEKASLAGAVLDDAEMTGANFSEANLEGASAERAGLGLACLTATRMFNISLAGASLTKADLSGADLRHSNLQGVRLREASLRDVDCTVADFRGADLSLTDMTGAVLDNSDMRDARLRAITGFKKARWYGVDIRDINFAGAYLLRRHVVDENYLKEFRNASRVNMMIFHIWSTTSDCGRSIKRWLLWILAIMAFFSVIYAADWEGMADRTEFSLLSPIYYSVVTITTLGYGDLTPVSNGLRVVAMCEVLVGYIMLGGLLSIFSNKMARRGE